MTDISGNPLPQIVQEAASDAIRLKALLRYPDYLVRRGAAECLGKMGAYHCLAPLTDALHDPDAVVREAAAIAIGQVKDLPNIQRKLSFFEAAPDDVVALHALTRALKDRELRVRQAAATSLKVFGREAMPAQYGEELGPGEDERTSPEKPIYLPYSYPVGEKALLPRRKHYPPLERTMTIPPSIINARYDLSVYRSILETGNPEEREAVVWAMGVMREADGIPLLVAALRDNVEKVRLSAVRSLGLVEFPPLLRDRSRRFEDRHEDQMVKDSLVKLLKDRSIDIRREAIETLVKLKAPDTTRYLVERLKYEDGDIRAILIAGLGTLGDATGIPAILAAAEDLDTRVRLAAIGALDHFLNEGGLPPALTGRMLFVLRELSRVDVDLSVCEKAGSIVNHLSPEEEEDAA